MEYPLFCTTPYTVNMLSFITASNRYIRAASTSNEILAELVHDTKCLQKLVEVYLSVLVEVHVACHGKYMFSRNHRGCVLAKQTTGFLELVHRDETFTTHTSPAQYATVHRLGFGFHSYYVY